jgi:ABC-type nitrate/sulfonate/bicarbonate transport system substrate-binding protein
VLFWAGIDGLKPSNTVEQIGTRSDCADGVVDYFAWYELWPLQLSTIKLNNISISAGDAVRASVSGNNSSKTFSMVITDETTRVSTHARGRFANASLSSAEWIVEAPGYTNGTRRTMANFTSVTFSSNFATISDQTKPLIAYPSQGQAYGMEYIDLCSDGGIKLQPSPIDSTDNSFAIKWLAGANC